MNNLSTEADIINVIKEDEWMMSVLKNVRKLNLPDWWIGAGFIRSKVWDTLHNYKVRTPLNDVDIIYFDKDDYSEEEANSESTKKEIYYESLLKSNDSNVNWSVTNQARMHLFHNDRPYASSEDALSQWVETATCIGVRLLENDELQLSTPRGIKDLVNLILRPSITTPEGIRSFDSRVKNKKWLIKWPKLKVIKN